MKVWAVFETSWDYDFHKELKRLFLEEAVARNWAEIECPKFSERAKIFKSYDEAWEGNREGFLIEEWEVE